MFLPVNAIARICTVSKHKEGIETVEENMFINGNEYSLETFSTVLTSSILEYCVKFTLHIKSYTVAL